VKIGELSRRTGVSIRMLRYYEGEGLLEPQRTSSGYRDYGPADEEAVRRIKVLGTTGMTLETIKQLLPCVRNNRPDFRPCDNLRRVLAQQVGLIDQRIEALTRSRTILAGFISSVN